MCFLRYLGPVWVDFDNIGRFWTIPQPLAQENRLWQTITQMSYFKDANWMRPMQDLQSRSSCQIWRRAQKRTSRWASSPNSERFSTFWNFTRSSLFERFEFSWDNSAPSGLPESGSDQILRDSLKNLDFGNVCFQLRVPSIEKNRLKMVLHLGMSHRGFADYNQTTQFLSNFEVTFGKKTIKHNPKWSFPIRIFRQKILKLWSVFRSRFLFRWLWGLVLSCLITKNV